MTCPDVVRVTVPPHVPALTFVLLVVGVPQPDGTVTVTYELALKSLPAGAVKVKAKLLPVDAAVTEPGATVIVPSPLTAVPALTVIAVLTVDASVPSVAVSV